MGKQIINLYVCVCVEEYKYSNQTEKSSRMNMCQQRTRRGYQILGRQYLKKCEQVL
jgi:hypothetical protein